MIGVAPTNLRYCARVTRTRRRGVDDAEVHSFQVARAYARDARNFERHNWLRVVARQLSQLIWPKTADKHWSKLRCKVRRIGSLKDIARRSPNVVKVMLWTHIRC